MTATSNTPSSSSQRLAWIEGIRIFAAVAILLYHAQLLITDYAFTPQPTGLLRNLGTLAYASGQLSDNWVLRVLTAPVWFGFQFVDVFVLISGFSLVLSLKNKPMKVGLFLRQRFLRILWTFWVVAWLSYPVLWLIGILSKSYTPDSWHIFAGATFPLLFDFGAQLLLPTSGPWWFVALILCFTLVFPLLWHLLQRWGIRNLLIVSLLVTLIYRSMAVYWFGGHPTYSVYDTSADWLPFLSFIAKLSTFVCGMVTAELYRQGKGPIFWPSTKALSIGISLYLLGSISQFYRIGWILCDMLLPLGLTLCCMVAFKALTARTSSETMLRLLGFHSYSYFLIHNFVIDRTIHLIIKDDLYLYFLLLPAMIIGTLNLAMAVDYVTPFIKHWVIYLLKNIDNLLKADEMRPLSSQSVERGRS